jgi:hypothetical protein
MPRSQPRLLRARRFARRLVRRPLGCLAAAGLAGLCLACPSPRSVTAQDGLAGDGRGWSLRADGPRLDIDISSSFDSLYTIADLQVSAIPASSDFHFRWDIPGALGVGPASGPAAGPGSAAKTPARFADNRRVLAVFATAGIHEISVSAFDADDRRVASATGHLTIGQGSRLSDGDARGPYRTLPRTGAPLALDGRITGVVGGGADSFPLLARAGRFTLYRATSSGYFRLKTEGGWWCDVFVSPLPSHHVDRPDRDWYLTQWNTETQSNCGPTAAAMGIAWASGRAMSVVDVRRLVGWQGSGAVSLEELRTACSSQGVAAAVIDLASANTIFDELLRNRLVILAYNMVGIPATANPRSNLVGQYYEDEGGHYLVLKGFSLDRRNVIVYDPIPSDWAENALRYADGVSMLGRNRYYPVDYLWNSLSARQALVVRRN